MYFIKIFKGLIQAILILKYIGFTKNVDVYIPNEKYNLYNIQDLISTYSNKYNSINIFINDTYYKPNFPIKGNQLSIPANTNITISGSRDNGTIIDLSYSLYYSIHFNEWNNQFFIIENITFLNFYDPSSDKSNYLFYIKALDINYNIIFKNCTFDGSESVIFGITNELIYYKNLNRKDYQISFDSCIFKNISKGVFDIAIINDIKHDNSLRVKFVNSEFINCSNVIRIIYGTIYIENCKFTELYSLSGNSILINLMSHSSLTIKNTHIYNINNNNDIAPLIRSKGNTINFDNVTMENVNSKIGFLIENYGKNTDIDKINISNSHFNDICTLIYGYKTFFKMENTIFENIKSMSVNPVISSLSNSINILTNCIINNISLQGTSLFNDLSLTILKNTIIKNISTFYKPIFKITYNSIELYNVNIENIIIYGEINECSLLSVESGEKQYTVKFQNVNIFNTKSNGNIMNFIGYNSNILFENVFISNSDSYGSFLKCDSENNNITFQNTTFSNNINSNKFEKGLFYLKNNVNIDISNSIFNDNISHSNGILYFDKVKNFNFKINNSSFSNNNCDFNGGVINLIDNDNNLETYNKSLIIEDGTFKNNTANFGGAIYTNVIERYDILFENTKFYNNNAKIAGGAIFFEKINNEIKNKLFKYLKYEKKNYHNEFYNNHAVSHGDNYATHPVKFIKRNDFQYDKSIYSGSYISLDFELYDDLENIVYDKEKYYVIDINIELYDYTKKKITNTNSYYISKYDSLFSNGTITVNYFKILVENSNHTYYIKISAKNNSFQTLKNAEIFFDVFINECSKDLIKINLDSTNLFFCESPICKKSCQSLINYECIKGNDTVNNPEYNKCLCKKGYTGEICNEKIFIEYK
eukprot:jgi/Orpsp1_1/1180696/evm.model.c7180000074342.1